MSDPDIFVTPTGCRAVGSPACRSSTLWYLPAQKRDARAEYEAAHIPGALFFDQDDVVDPDSDLPHTLPPAGMFARMVGSMGISADDTIVVYDGPGLFSAPRVWWMFRIMGARKVFLLDGGVDRWKAEGRPLTAEPTKVAPNVFECRFRRRPASPTSRRCGASSRPASARSPTRGRPAASPAPTRSRAPGVRGGHMPGAASVPADSLSRDGKLLPPEALARASSTRPASISKSRSSRRAARASPRR